MLAPLLARGARVDAEAFAGAYRREVQAYLEEVGRTGVEQHNTLWVARALTSLGLPHDPGDAPVVDGVRGYFTRYAAAIRMLPGAVEALAALRRTHRLALVSNFTDGLPVRTVLAREGLDGTFASVVISAEVGRCKPHPEVFAKALRELGAPASRTLFVGDDPEDDVRGAAAMGMRTAWVRPRTITQLRRWAGTRAADAAEAPRADLTVDSVSELVRLVS
jgi:HAD superfamily hydrolase (TIGR01509 family)